MHDIVKTLQIELVLFTYATRFHKAHVKNLQILLWI